MAEHGYQPISQQWVPSDAGRGCFWIVIIVILLISIIGILLLPFVMGGTLTVTYGYLGGPPARSGYSSPPTSRSMSPRTPMRKSFIGRTPEEARAQLQADLAEARAAGFVPNSERWGGARCGCAAAR
jgi:hypothetical protein